jgi:putative ABC transport system permease protein
MSLSFYFRYAVRSLRRGGQRTLLAMVCIAFGVMSLVALQTLAGLFARIVVSDPRLEAGGDLLIQPRQSEIISSAQLARLEQLQAEGKLGQIAYTAKGDANLLKPANTGHTYIMLNSPTGIDPAIFPLAGKFELADTTEPLTKLLAEPGSALITRDLAEQLNLKVGDGFSLSGSPGSPPYNLKIAAIANDTPRHLGDSVFYNLETARQIAGQNEVITEISALVGSESAATLQQTLEADGTLNVLTVADVVKINNDPAHLFDLMFKGAGILGLLIGGIGVANTLQVIFARRTLEIAVLKTLGYRQRDLLFLFGLETVLLGLAGSLLGAVLALALSAVLVGLFKHLLSLLIDWSVNPWLLGAGMLAGISTTLVFGTYAIVRASGVRPALVLRALPGFRSWGARFQAAGLGVLMLLIFSLISSVIMGSVIDGLGVVVFALVGLIGLSLIFGSILFITTRLPLPGLRMLKLAQRSLKRQQFRAIFPLVALFAGIFTIGFSTMVISSAVDRFFKRGIATTGENLFVFTQSGEVNQISQQLTRLGFSGSPQYSLPVQTRLNNQIIPELNLLQGRPFDTKPSDLELNGMAWGTQPAGAYIPAAAKGNALKVPIGSELQITTADGQTQTVKVIGTYSYGSGRNVPQQLVLGQPHGLLVSNELALKSGGSKTSAVVVGQIPTEQLETVTANLGKRLPSNTVISLVDINDAVQRRFKDLLTLAIAVAGLALVAGAVLIANSVGLAMVERRREIGIFKAIGFSRWQVLGTTLLEQSLLGLLGGGLGIVAVGLAILVVNQLQPQAELVFNVVQAIIMLAVSIGLALLSAGVTGWNPTGVRPLEVLRDE